MKGQSFSLKPFPATVPLPSLETTGSIARRAATLTLRYALRGALTALAMPPPAAQPARRRGLWEATCFEFFLAVKNAPCYWEFNLSPGGHWNVYAFADYRRGMAEEMAFSSLPWRVQTTRDSLLLDLELDLAGIIRADQAVTAAVAAVLELQNGEATYWALAHPGPQPDFHRRDSFLLEL